jgi:hypothetical protein
MSAPDYTSRTIGDTPIVTALHARRSRYACVDAPRSATPVGIAADRRPETVRHQGDVAWPDRRTPDGLGAYHRRRPERSICDNRSARKPAGRRPGRTRDVAVRTSQE